MKEVTKHEFKEMYFKLGGGQAAGWGLDHWNEFLEKEKVPPMKYLVQPPETPAHTRMMIVTDYQTHQHRLFFLTEEDEERLFDYPGKD